MSDEEWEQLHRLYRKALHVALGEAWVRELWDRGDYEDVHAMVRRSINAKASV